MYSVTSSEGGQPCRRLSMQLPASQATHLLTPEVHQPGGLLPVEQCIRGLAPGAQHVVIDIPSQHALERLWHELALHDQALLPVQRAAGTQLRHQEGLHVLGLAVHGLAQVHEVDEDRLLGPLTRHLRGLHDRAAPLASQLRVVLPEDAEHAAEQLIIGVVAVRPLPGQARGAGGLGIALSPLTLAFKVRKVVQVAGLGLLLLLLVLEVQGQVIQVEVLAGGGGGLLARSRGGRAISRSGAQGAILRDPKVPSALCCTQRALAMTGVVQKSRMRSECHVIINTP